MTLVFFAVSGLDMLGALDTMSAKEKQEAVDWIYAQQILPGEDGDLSLCGFRGSSFIGAPFQVLHSCCCFTKFSHRTKIMSKLIIVFCSVQ